MILLRLWLQLTIAYLTTATFFLSTLLTPTLQTNTYLKSSPSIQTRMLLLYSSPNVPLSASTTNNYTIIFNTAFRAQPIIAIGNAGYTSLDQLYNQLWSIRYTLNINWTSMVANVRIQTNTKTRILWVCYLAVDGSYLPGLIQVFTVQYTSQLVNTSSGTGRRSDTILNSIPSTTSISTSSIITTVTNTLYMRTLQYYQFTISSSLVIDYIITTTPYNITNTTTNITTTNYTTTNTSYVSHTKIQINVVGDIRFQLIGFYIIVINKNMITGTNYYQVYVGSVQITNSTTLYSTDVLNITAASLNTYGSNISISNVHAANFLMVFSSWGSNAALSSAFNCSLSTVNSTVNNTNGTQVLLIANPNLIGYVTYNYFIFGIVDCVYWSVRLQQCVGGCVVGETDGSDKGICFVCSSACLTCTNSRNNCTSCASNYYLDNITCRACSPSVLLYQCGYVPPPPIPNNTNNTNSTNNTNTTDPSIQTQQNNPSPPYWLASLSIIPITAIAVYMYCRYKRLQTIVISDNAPSFRQYPSIEF